MKIGQKLIARLPAQQLRVAGEIFYTEAKEAVVFVASMKGDRLKVSNETGLIFPAEFILTDGIWQSDHGWYIQQNLPTVIYQGRSLAIAS